MAQTLIELGEVPLKIEKFRLLSQRSRFDIMACILESCKARAGEIRLMHTCKLGLSQFNLYRDFLVETGLLTASGQKSINAFQATEKGIEFLKDYEKIKKILSKPDR